MADDQRRYTGGFEKVPGSSPGATGSAARQSPLGATPHRSPTLPGGIPSALRSTRAAVIVPVRCKFDSIIDFVETQSVNISRTGMYLTTSEVVPVGTVLELEVGLADGSALLKGKAEVVRVGTTAPQGLGVRFVELDAASQRLVDRIVEVNTQEGKKPTVALDFANDAGRGGAAQATGAGVTWSGDSSVAIELNPFTVSYFVYNPLLNIRLGGFVVPAEREVSLGTMFTVTITTAAGVSLFQGKGKVVAKHEKRLGIRLTEVDKVVLGRLQTEVQKLASAGK
jgi:uncharacterized protein (TIGR02266 family)